MIALMRAVGMVKGHLTGCFRYEELARCLSFHASR
jgi:3-methyladenine DNA glycosylase Tag